MNSVHKNGDLKPPVDGNIKKVPESRRQNDDPDHRQNQVACPYPRPQRKLIGKGDKFHRIAPDKDYKALIETLVQTELVRDHRSKEIIILAPGVEGVTDPKRSGYTWNALIAPALQWAGVA